MAGLKIDNPELRIVITRATKDKAETAKANAAIAQSKAGRPAKPLPTGHEFHVSDCLQPEGTCLSWDR